MFLSRSKKWIPTIDSVMRSCPSCSYSPFQNLLDLSRLPDKTVESHCVYNVSYISVSASPSMRMKRWAQCLRANAVGHDDKLIRRNDCAIPCGKISAIRWQHVNLVTHESSFTRAAINSCTKVYALKKMMQSWTCCRGTSLPTTVHNTSVLFMHAWLLSVITLDRPIKSPLSSLLF